MTQPGIYVENLAAVQRELKNVGYFQDTKEIQEALKKGAAIVADDARQRVPRKSGTAAGSIRASATKNKAYVIGGKKSVPYYGWLDFGARTPKHGQPRSVGPWANSGKGPKGGRFIYPAIDAKIEEVARYIGDAFDAVLRKDGFL